MTSASDEGLCLAELKQQGGSWSGHLFDNPNLRLRAAITWTFTLEFAEVARDYGSSPVNLSIEWVPLDCHSWLQMSGQHASCARFAEPIETSVYFFEHYRFDSVVLSISDQDQGTILIDGTVSGDVDGLGIDKMDFSQWLRFDGVYVNLSDPAPSTVQEAAGRLAEFLDIGDLTSEPRAGSKTFSFIASADA